VYANDRLLCSGVDLSALAEEFGTPLYVYSADAIRERLGMLEGELAGLDHTVCYAVKANSSLAILKMLGEAGCGFDIVSGGELERVRRACPEAVGRVVFSGVGKQVWEMDLALELGILLFNVESEGELEVLSARAVALGKVARVALRVNPDVFAETHPYISTGLSEHKFGIAIAKARAVYARARELPGLDPAGVSVHIGSQIREVGPVCESGDFFARDRETEELWVGDLVVLLDAGAYGMAQASNYNTRGRAVEVMVDAGKVRLVRRRETVEEMLVTEIL
jgi:diaminopimelate decarboxylase